MEYSLNGGEWAAYTSGIALSAGDSVKFKGNNPEFLPGSTTVFKSTGAFNVSGNPLSVIDSVNFENITNLTTLRNSGTNLLRYLFYNTNVRDASRLVLPADTLSSYCYSNMFYNCRTLTKGPVLPARILGERCYQQMFYNCQALTEVKMLAETLAPNSLYNWLYSLPDNVSFEFNLRCPESLSNLTNNYSLNKTVNWYCNLDVNSVSSDLAVEMYNFFDETNVSSIPTSATLINSEVLDIGNKIDIVYNENSLATYNNGVLRSTIVTGTQNNAFSNTITINQQSYNIVVPLTVMSRTPTNGNIYINTTKVYQSAGDYNYTLNTRHVLLNIGPLPISLSLTFDVGTLRNVTANSSDGVLFSDVNGHVAIENDQCSVVSSGLALFTAEINNLTYSGYFPATKVTITWTGASAISGASTAEVGTTLSASSGYTYSYEMSSVEGYYLSSPDYSYSFNGRYTSYFTGSWNKTTVSFKKTGSGPSGGFTGTTAYCYVIEYVKFPGLGYGNATYDYTVSRTVNLRR